jgi:hypothetical protein
VARARRAELEFRCEERLVENARPFFTFDAEHAAWGGQVAYFEVPKGAFVRLEPPEFVDDAQLAGIRDYVASFAERVVVLPRRRPAEVLAPREARPHRRAREVVLELVAESPEEGRAELAAFCEEVMARRGL